MPIRTIIKSGDPTLRKISKPVENFDQRLYDLLDDLTDTLLRTGGLGLAAVQVGVLRRVYIVILDKTVYEVVNPVLISTKGECKDDEGCLSVEGIRGIVSRPEKIVLSYQDRFGKPVKIKKQGYDARVFLHELDHLNGILFTDIMEKQTENGK